MADFRDPWTDVYYYEMLGHSALSKKIDKRLEKNVLKNVDGLITVSENLQKQLQSISNLPANDCHIIHNGFDEKDFEDLKKLQKDKFRIIYTGSITEQYQPESVFKGIEDLIKKVGEDNIKVQFIGNVTEAIKHRLNQLKTEVEIIPQVSHVEIVKYQKSADLLLLFIPRVKNAELIVTGKLFEYLASGNRILSVGPVGGDADLIIQKCEAGENFDWDAKDGIREFLLDSYDEYSKKLTFQSRIEQVQNFSRRNQAEKLKNILKGYIQLNK